MTSPKGTGSQRWWVRALLAVLASVLGGLIFAMPAHADDCKPSGVPAAADSGLPAMIDDKTTEANPKTLYGQYGWAGLNWHVCDLGDGSWGSDWVPEPARDPDTYADTTIGNMGMSAAQVLAAFMTQLHDWVSDPSGMMAPIDGAVTDVNTAVMSSTWTPWVTTVIIVSACFVAAWASRGDIRRAARTVAAILVALGLMAFMVHDVTVLNYSDAQTRPGKAVQPTKEVVPGALAMAQQFDHIAASVVGAVDSALLTNGKKEDIGGNEARGATLQDKVLYPIWAHGAVGTGEKAAERAKKFYEIQSVKWNDLNKTDPEKRREAYKKAADELKKEDPAAYRELTGKARDRAGLGFLAFLYMFVIALVRIPAELLILAGLLVVRVVVMLSPVFALAAVVESTRPIALSAMKMVLAAVYNSAVFGVIAAVHTAIVAAIVASNQDQLVLGLVMIIGLTMVILAASKPFRSVTKPATGKAVAAALEGAGEQPGHMMGRVAGLAGTVASTYLGSKLGSRSGTKEGIEEEAEGHTAEAETVIPPTRVQAIRVDEPHVQRRTVDAETERYELPPTENYALPRLDRYELPAGGGATPMLDEGSVPPQLGPGDDVSTVEDLDLQQRVKIRRATEYEADDEIFHPEWADDPLTIKGEVVEVSAPVSVHLEPEVTKTGEVTMDVWTPEPRQLEMMGAK